MTESTCDWEERLSAWLPVWDAAGVPYVPAAELGRAPVGELAEAAINGKWSPRVVALMARVGGVPKGYMVRWDHGTGDYMKAFMDGGHLDNGAQRGIPQNLDDPLFYERCEDMIARRGEDFELILWQRPWEQAVVVDGYPVEYRVFVLSGEVQGVSSYYPQRPLPWECEWLTYAGDARRHTWKLLRHTKLRDFTADFLVSVDKEHEPERPGARHQVVLLECGPPHVSANFAGADPCCFCSGETRGVVLAPQPGSEAERANQARKERQPLWSTLLEPDGETDE